MAGDVVNIKVCSPLKLCNGLTGNHNATCHNSYNLPLGAIVPNKVLFQAESTFRQLQLV